MLLSSTSIREFAFSIKLKLKDSEGNWDKDFSILNEWIVGVPLPEGIKISKSASPGIHISLQTR